MSNIHYVPDRHKWEFNTRILIDRQTGLIDKEALRDFNFDRLSAFATMMFEWKNLPDTITPRIMERRLMLRSGALAIMVEGKPYLVDLSCGGLQDINEEPTLGIVANPRIPTEFKGDYRIANSIPLGITYTDTKGDCVLLWNDEFHMGLQDYISKYASLLTEAEISLEFACINNRVKAMAIADTDSSKESIDQFFKDIVQGTKLGGILGQSLSEAIKVWPFSQSATGAIKETLESIQYILASFYNGIGVQAQFNMKREAINSSESGLNELALRPSPDSMLSARKEGLEWLKKTFPGVFDNTSVDFASAWKLQEKETDAEAKALENPMNENQDKPENKEEENNVDDEKTAD